MKINIAAPTVILCKTRLGRAMRVVLTSLSLATLTLAMTGCHKSAEAAQESPSVVEVATTSPERKDLTRVVTQPGYLRPYEVTPIYTKISGFAEEPKFDIGDYVKKDELLVQIYVPEVVQELQVKKAKIELAEADVEQAKASADAAKAAMDAAKADIDAKRSAIKSAEATIIRWQAEVERARKLVARGTYDEQTLDENIKELRVSEAKRDEARANYDSSSAYHARASANFIKFKADITVAEASVKVAKATHAQQRDWLSYSRITAPYDGVITNRLVHTGHFLQPANSGSTSKSAEPLFVMMRTDKMRCTVEVPELDALVLKRGDKAIIHFQAMPGTEFEGAVTRTTKALDERTRTLRVEIHLDNPTGLRLRPNMYANVSIFPKLRDSWVLPQAAVMNDILADGNRSYCFAIEDGKAHKLFLEKGLSCEEGLQVIRKQRPGQTQWEDFTGKEIIATSNNRALQEGQEVQVKTATKR